MIVANRQNMWIKDHNGPKLDEPLCFTAVDAGATITFKKVGSPDAASIVTSTDGRTWTNYAFGTVITLANIGDKVYFRAADENDISFRTAPGSQYEFATTDGKKIAASGNIQTLMKADGSRLDISGKNYCYSYMFYNCTSLTTAPVLPATTLAEYCYFGMFVGCTSLTIAPRLPAMTIADGCYQNMFKGCTSLTIVPELPATTLAESCYSTMFNACMSLTIAPELPATTLVDNCYYYMFYNCSNLASIDVSFTAWSPTNATTNWVYGAGTSATRTKTFTCPATLPKTIGTSNIPTGWTIVEK